MAKGRSTTQDLHAALAHHQAGRWREAQELYQRVLTADPGNPDALHLLGVVASQNTRFPEAEQLIRRAIGARPGVADYHNSLAIVLQNLGRLTEAETAYREAARINPSNADAHHNLGMCLAKQNRWQEAADSYVKVIALNPGHAQAHASLGVAHASLGQFDAAAEAYRKALQLKPDMVHTLSNLGRLYLDQGKFELALGPFEQAVKLDPNRADVYTNLGAANAALGQYDEAATAYEKAIRLEPGAVNTLNNLGDAYLSAGRFEPALTSFQQAVLHNPERAEFHTNLGLALEKLGRFNEAIIAHQHAIELSPDLFMAYVNLGLTLSRLGRAEDAAICFEKAMDIPSDEVACKRLAIVFWQFGLLDEAVAAARRATAMKPEYAEAHFFLSTALLRKGAFEEGWREYEWRFQCPGFVLSPARNRQPAWNGADPAGRTILLYQEQGLGDAIQFARYAPLLAGRGADMILICRPPLKALFQTLDGVRQVITTNEKLPPHDLTAWMMSLPRLLGTTLDNVPARVPYLGVDPAKAEFWRGKLKSEQHSLKVGLVWAGNPGYAHDRRRSIALRAFAPLADIPGIHWYSLQKDAAGLQVKDSPLALRDYTAHQHDLSDTAALVANLDLVIAVDTAIAHLAGALGKPVWTLLSFAHDWRWLTDREDSPWYPTMRLFRRPSTGGWTSVIARLADELARLQNGEA
jgi:tetratricopeptide (TPR) repeat protein